MHEIYPRCVCVCVREWRGGGGCTGLWVQSSIIMDCRITFEYFPDTLLPRKQANRNIKSHVTWRETS
jgi:hypothetical protein